MEAGLMTIIMDIGRLLTYQRHDVKIICEPKLRDDHLALTRTIGTVNVELLVVQ